MPNPVLLNNVDHADLHVRIAHGGEFGDLANQIAVFPTEFEEAQREFAILFRRNADGGYASVILTGLEPRENLFFARDRWLTRFVPAVQARGPFSIGVTRGPDGEARAPQIHIDLDDPRVGGAGGLPLFRPHGGNAPMLEAAARVLQTLYAGIEAQGAMFAAFEAEGLIAPVQLEIEVDERRRYTLPDCHTIATPRLAALDGAALERLNRAGHLAPAMFVAASLGNVQRLIELKRERDGTG